MAGRTDPDRTRPGQRPRLNEKVTFRFDEDRVELTLKGPRLIRTAYIEGLAGSEDAKLYNALSAVGIPQLGAEHPVVSGAIVGQLSAVFLKDSPSQAKVTITYGFFTEDDFNNIPGEGIPQIEVSSTVQPTVTSKDAMGDPIILHHDFLEVDEDEGTSTLVDVPQRAEIEFQLPMTRVIIRQREASGPRIPTPGANGRTFGGTINSKPVFNDPPHFWLCTGINATSDDRGATNNVTYEFQYNRDSWDPTVIYTDTKTGGPIMDPVPDKGIKQVQIYPEANFRNLPIDSGIWD